MNQHSKYAQGTTLLAVGTKRGLFLLSSKDRETWEIEATPLKGRRIFNAILDQRKVNRLFATENGIFFGTFLRYTDAFVQTCRQPIISILLARDIVPVQI